MAGIFETGSAVLGVAAAAIKLFTLIVEIADATRTIRIQLQNDALPFRSFRDLIETAEYSIKFRLPAAGTDLVAYMHDRNIFRCIEEEARALDEEIAVQMMKIQLLQRKHANEHSGYPNQFYAAWRWEKIRKPKLESLHPRMEQLKSTIQLVLAIIQLEVMARNGEASRSGGRSEEIEKLRDLIGKNIEAIEQLRKEFPSVAQVRIGNRRVDSAAEICYLASTVRNTGKVPQLARQLPPPPVSESKRTLRESPDFERWPSGNLPPATCPQCYRAIIDPQRTLPSSREGSRQRPRRYKSRTHSDDSSPPPLRPAGYRPRNQRPQQDTEPEVASGTIRVIPAQVLGPASQPDRPATPKADTEPTNSKIDIQQAPRPDSLMEQSSEPQPRLEEDPLPATTSNGDHASSRSPSTLPDMLPTDSQVPSQPLSAPVDQHSPDQDGHHPVPAINGGLEVPAPLLTRSRRPTAERLPVLTSVEILDYRGQWKCLQVQLDTSLYVANRHGHQHQEIHYYGIISLRTLIDELRWPEETLLEDPRFVEIPNDMRFNWNLERLEGIGRVTLTWRVDQSDDEWENAVVPKMTMECIVSKQDPCKQGMVLKAMPAPQNV